ncbi:hypothetical protein ACN27F_14455 [Solwaraspora sp. WMMB335]|uniref:hypothetical protein n=1 Tax=Solwaraspora sp. WMMB335 TaxID=3404118 RepID=UPI003B94F93D
MSHDPPAVGPPVPPGAPVAPAAPASAPARQRWRRWLLAAVAVMWIVALVGLATVSTRQDGPTVREQRGIDEARSVAERAAGHLIAAVGDAGVVVVGAERIVEGCRITPLRTGAELTRTLTAYTTPTAGPALLDRIAQRLPADYAALTRHGGASGGSRLGADAGEFVAIRGDVPRPGVVELRISTGCRPPAEQTPVANQVPPTSRAQTVIETFGVDDIELAPTVRVRCPNGGSWHTDVAVGSGPAETAEQAAQPISPGATVLSDQPPVYVQWDPTVGGLVVEADGGKIRVTTTSNSVSTADC